MALYEWLENLQNKPDAYKRRVVTVVSAVFILIIGALWIASVQDRLATTLDNPVSQQETEISEETARVSSPFGSLRAAVGSGFEGLREQFDSLRKNIIPGEGSEEAGERSGGPYFPLPTESQ